MHVVTTTQVDRELDHAVEIDAAVKFVEWLAARAPAPTELGIERLRELAVECFCGR